MGQKPEVRQYVDDWAHELLKMCLQSDSSARPSFGEILNLFSAHFVPIDEDWQKAHRVFDLLKLWKYFQPLRVLSLEILVTASQQVRASSILTKSSACVLKTPNMMVVMPQPNI